MNETKLTGNVVALRMALLYNKNSQVWRCFTNKEAQAMASFYKWRCSTQKLTSNGVALQNRNETQPND